MPPLLDIVLRKTILCWLFTFLQQGKFWISFIGDPESCDANTAHTFVATSSSLIVCKRKVGTSCQKTKNSNKIQFLPNWYTYSSQIWPKRVHQIITEQSAMRAPGSAFVYHDWHKAPSLPLVMRGNNSRLGHWVATTVISAKSRLSPPTSPLFATHTPFLFR